MTNDEPRAATGGTLSSRMRELARRIEAAPDAASAEAGWCELERLLEAMGSAEVEEIALPVLERSLADVRALLDGWEAGTLPLPACDKGLLKRALKAFRKRLKIVRLDDTATDNRNPLTRGVSSAIQGVRPPEQYPQEVWDLLVAQGKLRDAGHGLLELADD